MTKLWGSRFSQPTDKLADKFSFSIAYDHRLALYDVLGSIAHAKMLGHRRIISSREAAKIVGGLKTIAAQIARGLYTYDPDAEDIHTDIQIRLKKIVGEVADKLHTARSRNDLIVLDMKLYCLDEINRTISLIRGLQASILAFAKRNISVIVPAYTHLQAAQVVLLAHHMLAYLEMLERDKSRLKSTFMRSDTMPLGSCALSGTSLPIDRKAIAKELGFMIPTSNSIDAVSDRDFIIEFLANLAILGMHFSRIAEDLILWSSSEFQFIEIDGAFCTGSSIMPHKKNPDILELIRGETATLYGNLNQVLVLMKGLPLCYNRDMQLDKPPLFEAIDKSQEMIVLLSRLFSRVTINASRIRERLKDESFFSVDVMEYLIKKGVSYRAAHDTVGKMVKDGLDKKRTLSGMTLAELRSFHPKFEADVKKLFSAENSVKIKTSLGSTNPALVAKQIKEWEALLK